MRTPFANGLAAAGDFVCRFVSEEFPEVSEKARVLTKAAVTKRRKENRKLLQRRIVVFIITNVFRAAHPSLKISAKADNRVFTLMHRLAGIIVNLLLLGSYYDIALRDFGFFLGALALSRPAMIFDHPHTETPSRK
jgi:hypothetical protein